MKSWSNCKEPAILCHHVPPKAQNLDVLRKQINNDIVCSILSYNYMLRIFTYWAFKEKQVKVSAHKLGYTLLQINIKTKFVTL